MKKVLLLVLAFVILTSALVFASCELIPAYPTSSNEIRYTITEDEWNEIMSYKKFTIVSRNGEIIKKTENAVLFYTPFGYYEFIVYEGGIAYDLRLDNGAWLAQPLSEGELNDTLGDFLEKMEFSNLEYNEESHSYLYVEENFVIELCFENGKLVSGNNKEGDFYVTFIDFGTTIIDIPEYTIVEDKPITPYPLPNN